MDNPTTVARLSCDEATARRVAAFLGESLDAEDTACAAFEDDSGQWHVAIHFRFPPDEAALRDLVRLAAGDKAATALTLEPIAATDWVAQSLEGLKPVPAGRFLVHGAHDRKRVPSHALGIEIEAALAFGTGHHGTTRGCLLLLDRLLRRQQPQRVLDLGTGSGVLAIAAAKALRRHILASDIDRRATVTARDNARLNGAGPWVETICAPGFGAREFQMRGPFDLVLANILANPLKRLAAPMRHHLAPKAVVVLSGLLPSHANGVIATYQSIGLVLRDRIDLEGWTSLLMARR